MTRQSIMENKTISKKFQIHAKNRWIYSKNTFKLCKTLVNLLEQDLSSIFLIKHEFPGPWGADRAALVYLIHLEKLKTKAVYERHYLLLCLVFTVLLEIRYITRIYKPQHIYVNLRIGIDPFFFTFKIPL